MHCLQQRSSMTRAKKVVVAAKKASVSKGSNGTKKVVWVKNDNCCLLYAMWETLTKKQQDLLTVSDCKAVVGMLDFLRTNMCVKNISDGRNTKHCRRNEEIDGFEDR